MRVAEGLYYYGARYLDPKYSMWLSTDPALGEYIPGLDKDKNKNLPGMGGLFNQINANLFCTFGNNPINYVDPDGRELHEGATVSEQLSYLKSIAYANYATPQDKANAAEALRDEMRIFYPERFDLDGLFTSTDGNEKFMNEDLRSFLNTSDTGEDYTLADMEKFGWNKRSAMASKEHQNSADPNHPNLKYVNDADGREAVFTWIDGKYVLSNDEKDKGTYNYAADTTSWFSGWTSFGEHGRWDMDPYFRQFGKTPGYRAFFGYSYSKSDYNRNNK